MAKELAKDKRLRRKKAEVSSEILRENFERKILEEYQVHSDDFRDIWKKFKRGDEDGIVERYEIHPDNLPSLKRKLKKLYES